MPTKVKGRRGRPPGAKNKPKVQQLVLPAPVLAKSNGVRRTRRTPDRVALAGSIIQINRKHMLLIQKWSGETKIGVQQIFDDIFLAGASAAYKSFYRGLINSRRAAEAQFDAEANTQELAPSAARGTEQIDRLSDTRNTGPAPRPRIDEEQLSLVAVGPGQLEEADTDLEAIIGLDMHAAAKAAGLTGPEVDAPPSAPPEEDTEEEPDENEPPY